ncbi:MAG: xanthine dehydrogenase family protein molybdopterin-binding subunit, partial [Phycisphaerales bacterium]|nr:xanthine dehydrogenase family protein molybdopterin-binding subunit [Phycisphaerales bacterium]
VGGGFGSKLNGAGKEGLTAGRIAAKYGRPAWLFCDRSEEHLDTGNRPSSRTQVRVGWKRDGTIVGGTVNTWGGTGVAGGGGGVVIPSNRYELGRIEKQHADVRFNGGGPRAFRAPGHPQGAFAEELMLDEIATAMGRDPLDLRMKLDREDARREMYRLGARLIGWDQRRATGSQRGVMRRGMGVGSTNWNRFPAQAEAEVVIHPDASVEVRTGSQDIGTGQRTAMGVVAAARIGVPLDVIHVNIGDSTLPLGPASGGSVTATNTSQAMMQAAEEARTALLEKVAAQAGGEAGDLDVRDGVIRRGDDELMSWREACGLLGSAVVGRGQRNRGSDRTYGGEGHSMGVQFVDLEVDSETGVIHLHRIVAIQACGRVVCRKTAESQIIGGVIQGLSYALFEDKLLDRRTGAMVNPNLEFYRIAGTMDMPRIEPVLWEEGQTGVRPLGEPPTIPTSGAIACAVYNAIGSPVRDLPLRPDRVLAAVEGGVS